jgi:predicted N-acetyltransferase YhbS
MMITPEQPTDSAAIDSLLDQVFGLSRRTKTSYRLREGSSPVRGLSLVVREPGLGLAGIISYWPLKIGDKGTDALLLGPLAVHPQRQNRGIGLALMQQSLADAKQHGHKLVILVGDLPYYSRVGFGIAPSGKLVLPGPFNAQRLLYLDLVPGALEATKGLVLPPHRFHA